MIVSVTEVGRRAMLETDRDHTHHTATGPPRRADYGAVRLGQRDIDGLILCAEHFGAPYDLLADALSVQPARLRGITARWRRAGYAATERLGPRPAWCWLTPAGMTAAGLGYPATRPHLAPGLPGLDPGPSVVAFRAPLARRSGVRGWHRAPARRRDPLALHPDLPLSGAGLGPGNRADPQAGRPHDPDHGRPAHRTSAIRAGHLPHRARRPARGHPLRGRYFRRSEAQDHHPGPAPVRVHPGGLAMTVWSWLKLTIALWLIRKAVKATGWLLLAALAVAVWPLTLMTAIGYAAAWLRGWPPARLRRTAAGTLTVTAVYLLAGAARQHGWRALALTPARDWAHGWHHLDAGLAWRTFLMLVPVTVPAGFALAAALWAWRIYAITSGIGGRMASAPITFDARQWKRQVRAAIGRVNAPGAVPLLGAGRRIPVGGTIRAIGHRWRPV